MDRKLKLLSLAGTEKFYEQLLEIDNCIPAISSIMYFDFPEQKKTTNNPYSQF